LDQERMDPVLTVHGKTGLLGGIVDWKCPVSLY